MQILLQPVLEDVQSLLVYAGAATALLVVFVLKAAEAVLVTAQQELACSVVSLTVDSAEH